MMPVLAGEVGPRLALGRGPKVLPSLSSRPCLCAHGVSRRFHTETTSLIRHKAVVPELVKLAGCYRVVWVGSPLG